MVSFPLKFSIFDKDPLQTRAENKGKNLKLQDSKEGVLIREDLESKANQCYRGIHLKFKVSRIVRKGIG